MAKKSRARATQGLGGKKARGRTAITPAPVSPTDPHHPVTSRTEADRPVTAGTGKHRGDRRDMSKTYSGTVKHASRGSNPRPDVKTRRR